MRVELRGPGARLALGAFLLCCSTAAVQARAQVEALRPIGGEDGIHEVFRDGVPGRRPSSERVSALGPLGQGRALRPADSGCLHRAVRPPRLCVTIESVDGRYSATMEFDLKGVPAGGIAWDFPPRRPRSSAPTMPADLAVLAELGNDCSPGQLLPIVPVSWGPSPAGGGYTVLLSSLDVTDLWVVLDGTDRFYSCRKIESRTARSFDLRCELGPDLGSGEVKLTLVRLDQEVALAPVHLLANLP